jgi:hypothetical protein
MASTRPRNVGPSAMLPREHQLRLSECWWVIRSASVHAVAGGLADVASLVSRSSAQGWQLCSGRPRGYIAGSFSFGRRINRPRDRR